MQEAFLQHLWSLQYFSKKELITTQGETVEIFEPGTLNRDAGPDFSQARIRIGDMQWVGNVEIHTHSSGWFEHRHDDDPAYDSVILHVVWKDDQPVRRKDKSLLPTVELRGRVEESLVRNFRQLITSSFSIPCQRQFPSLPGITKTSMFARALAQRLESKAQEVQQLFNSTGCNWEETAYQLLAGAFGFKLNREPFLRLARMLPHRILQKHTNLEQVEALVFGQAGFLEGKKGDAYYQQLRKEFQVLSHKYSLTPNRLTKPQWLFLRLRPSNFPTLRLAQFCSIIKGRRSLFSGMIDITTVDDLVSFFRAPVSSYWTTHYRFAASSSGRPHELGRDSVEVLAINTVVPLLAANAQFTDDESFMDRALHLLEQLKPEKNNITQRWSDLGVPAQNAGEAQGQIELFNTFCQQKRCLQCAIGAAIIRPTEDEPGTPVS